MSRFTFERFQAPATKSGVKGVLHGMAVGEIREMGNRNRLQVYLAIRHRIKKHPNESYSWSPNTTPIAVRRDHNTHCVSCGSKFVNGNGSKKCPKCLSHVPIPNGEEAK